MDRERWERARVLFDELVELEPAARLSRLAELRAADPELHRVVDELLDADPMTDPRLSAFMMDSGAGATDALGLVGSTVGNFHLLRTLGSGGMGVVYLARDTRLGRAVALKFPHTSHQPDHASRDRLLREARAAAALDHPNLCAVHEVGTAEDGRPFIAMALCAGETLKACIARAAPLPLSEALGIAAQAARGLGAMHAAGMAHGDLKPGNLMLLPDGTVKILDFGLARTWEPSGGDADGPRGTPAYMAPEQVQGAQPDQRSDLWALGVVLYEMLTGLQPFRGQSEMSVLHAIVHDPPAPLLQLRANLPRPVQDLVHQLLTKKPADRPGTAQAVEARIAVLQARAGRSKLTRRWMIATGLAAGVVLTAVSLVAGRRHFEATTVRPGLLAVAPFDVPDPSLSLWREGLVDVLSQDLDGAGPITTVPQRTVLRDWSGAVDARSAEALGARTGAELVVYGTVVRLSADSVSLRAELLDRRRGVTTRNLEVAGTEQNLGRLADSLGITLLRLLGQTRPIGAVPNISFGSRSLPALKEFLRGEQFYRAGSWDSAAAHYNRAIQADGNFAVALRRMAQAIAWGAKTQPNYRSYAEYFQRAMALNRGLSFRDSLLFLADSLRNSLGHAPTPAALINAGYRAVEILEVASRRYPDDPEVWYDLGEVRYHGAVPFAGGPELAFEAFARGVAADSGFGSSYEHLPELALRIGRPDLAVQYAREGARLMAPPEAARLRLAAMLLDSGPDAPATARLLAEASDRWLLTVGLNLAWATDSAEASIAALRRFAVGRHSADSLTINDAVRPCPLSAALAFRGQLRESFELIAHAAPGEGCEEFAWDPFPDLALLGAVPDSVARRTFSGAFDTPVDWGNWTDAALPRPLYSLPWWYAHGDTAVIRRLAAHVAATARDSTIPVNMLRARYLEETSRAWLVLARGDTADAIRLFRGLSDSLCIVSPCFAEKVTLARLLAGRGELQAAAALLDRWWQSNGPTPTAVLASLDRARVAEGLGDRATAQARYQFVVDAWRHADPSLQAYVDEARRGLARLSGREQHSPESN